MKIASDLEFGWKNAIKPTPKNVELFLRGSRRTLAAAAGASYLLDHPEIMFWLGVIQVAIEELAVYIGEAVKPGEKERLIVEADKEVIDKLTETVKVSTETIVVDDTKIEKEEG